METAELFQIIMKTSNSLSESSKVRFWETLSESVIDSIGPKCDYDAESIRDLLRNFKVFINTMNNPKTEDDALLSIGKGRELGSNIGSAISKVRDLESGNGKKTNRNYLVCFMFGCVSSIKGFLIENEPAMIPMLHMLDEGAMEYQKEIDDFCDGVTRLRCVE